MHYFFRSDVRSYCMQKQANCGHWPWIIEEIKSLNFQLTSLQLKSVQADCSAAQSNTHTDCLLTGYSSLTCFHATGRKLSYAPHWCSKYYQPPLTQKVLSSQVWGILVMKAPFPDRCNSWNEVTAQRRVSSTHDTYQTLQQGCADSNSQNYITKRADSIVDNRKTNL